MKELSKKQTEELNERIDTLTKKQAAIEDAFDIFESAFGGFTQAIALYNEELEATKEWRDSIVTEMWNYYEEAEEDDIYEEWMSEWRSIDLEPCEMPEAIEEPSIGHADELDRLPHEPEAE